jgi:hypothetical protein
MHEMTYEEQIKESHPMRCEDPDRYKADAMAMKLVGERHVKRDLVNLVRWLIMDNAKTVNFDL